MRIGFSLFLLVVGAILTFAVNASISGLDLKVVGWVLMLAGLVGIVLFFAVWNRRRPPTALVSENRVYEDPPL